MLRVVAVGRGRDSTFTTSAAGLLDLHISNLGTGFGQHQITLIRTTPGPLSGSQTISVGETGRTHRVVSVQPGDYPVHGGSWSQLRRAATRPGSRVRRPT